jgi:uncharacterized protein YegL
MTNDNRLQSTPLVLRWTYSALGRLRAAYPTCLQKSFQAYRMRLRAAYAGRFGVLALLWVWLSIARELQFTLPSTHNYRSLLRVLLWPQAATEPLHWNIPSIRVSRRTFTRARRLIVRYKLILLLVLLVLALLPLFTRSLPPDLLSKLLPAQPPAPEIGAISVSSFATLGDTWHDEGWSQAASGLADPDSMPAPNPPTASPTASPSILPTAAPTVILPPEATEPRAMPSPTGQARVPFAPEPTQVAGAQPYLPSPTYSAPESRGPTRSPSDVPTATEVPSDVPSATEVPSDVPSATEVPSATPTDTPTEVPSATPTDTPTEVPTATEVPTDTPTEAPTATSTPSPSATPIVVPPTCVPEQSRLVDVALAIDHSGSMSGRKLDDAKRAARTFIELLDLQHNQAALVGFAREAQLGAGLTHDHAALESAIEALAPSHGSFVAEGIRLATAELLGERHHPQAAPVLILLTDGNADDVNEVRKVARNARAQNIQVIAVGFGKNVNETLLRNIVSSPSDFHQTSSSDDLAAIYAEIAAVIDRCPAVGDLLPPTSMPLPSPTPTVLPETDLKPDEET